MYRDPHFTLTLNSKKSTYVGVVGCGKVVVYLKSPGHPTDIVLQLDKISYPCSR